MGNWQRITVGIISILIVVVILLILMLSQIENRQTMKGAAENEARYDIAMKKIVENEARNELEKIICPPKCKQYNLEQWVVNLDKNSVMTCICFDPSSGCEMGFMYDLMEGTTINYMDTCTVKQSNSLAPITSNEKQQEINDYSKRVGEPYQASLKQQEVETRAKNSHLGIWDTLKTNTHPSSSSSEFDCSYNKYNCANFDTHVEAQKLFETCGGTSNDVHHLDGDQDGSACETLQ